MKHTHLAGLALAATALLPGTAQARDNDPVVYGRAAQPIEREQFPDGTRIARVNFGDLDLAQASGETALNGRIRIAVTYVCYGPLPIGYVSFTPGGGPLACARMTREAVQPKVDAVVAAARSGKQLAVTSFGFRAR
jgi:UrcA family protein